jgi:hypothetical protein
MDVNYLDNRLNLSIRANLKQAKLLDDLNEKSLQETISVLNQKYKERYF